MLLILFLASSQVWSKDLTFLFNHHYDQGPKKILSNAEVQKIAQQEIVLINGIMSEFFIREFVPNVSWITSEYFGIQYSHFSKMGLPVTKVAPSSFSISAALKDIAAIFPALKARNRKGILMVHSMGGLLVLDHLLAYPEDQDWVAGIIFIQTPFHGSPMAGILKRAPLDTIEYLKVKNRNQILNFHETEIRDLLRRIPALTVGTVANHTRTVFQATIMTMKYGCPVPVASRCLPPKLYKGPYDDSDGMVPLMSSHLFETDHVTLNTVDHGETIMNLPFQSILKSRMSEVLMKMLVNKDNSN